jgi:hypothetical protein
MKKFLLMVAVATLALIGPAASKHPIIHVIRDDSGGVLLQYIGKYVVWDNNGDSVRIEGACYSACTLVLGTVKFSRVCATREAVFGFHSASLHLRDEYSAEGTAVMWAFYSPNVRAKLSEYGWETPSYHPDLIMIRAQEIVRPCK